MTREIEKVETKPKQKKKRGKKPVKWTEEQIREAEEAVAFGFLSNTELATLMGIGKTTLYTMLEREPEIAARLERAKVRQKCLMVTKMTELALDGNVQALRWKLSVCHGLSERTQVELQTKDPIAAKVYQMSRKELNERAQQIVAKKSRK